MEKTVTLEEALKRIEELEKENAELREELEYYRNRKLSGRQKHNAKWIMWLCCQWIGEENNHVDISLYNFCPYLLIST